jgi:Leucine-rich repeat (LRR) protein
MVAVLLFTTRILAQAAGQDLFPDKNLEAAVREMVFEKRGTDKPLTEEDVRNLSTVTAKGKKIKDLKGLEKCAALASLDLSENEIVDLGPIKDLKNLQQLILPKNRIKDLSPLASLTALQYLDLNANDVEDVSPLQGLSKLTTLYLSQNRITDLSPVGRLTKLWSLYLDRNLVSDLSPLKELKWLSSLGLRGNSVSDLSPLAGLTELRSLFLEKNRIADLSPLVAMAKQDGQKEKRFAPYWRVYLAGNPLSDSARTSQIQELRAIGGMIVIEEKPEKETKGRSEP